MNYTVSIHTTRIQNAHSILKKPCILTEYKILSVNVLKVYIMLTV